MKIYRLVTNKVENTSTMYAISSNYSPRRDKIFEKFYLSKEKADAAAREKTEALIKLVGIMPNHEFRVEEIEVEE